MWREEAGFLTPADSELEKQQRGHQDEQRLATARSGQKKTSADIWTGRNLDLSVWFLLSNTEPYECFSVTISLILPRMTHCKSTGVGVQTAFKVRA